MDRAMRILARAMALAGGLVLVALVAMTCASILGRWLNGVGHGHWVEPLAPLADALKALGPVRGDFELVEAGVAFAVMAFLPWCQLTRAHASVDILTRALPGRVERLLALLWEVVFAAVIVIITWRLWVGMEAKARYGETTFMLQMPVWWGYAATFAASLVAALVALYAVWTRVRDLRAGPGRAAPGRAAPGGADPA